MQSGKLKEDPVKCEPSYIQNNADAMMMVMVMVMVMVMW